MNGVICLGRIHEVNLLDTLEHLVKIQLQPFPKCVVTSDLDAFMKWSVSNTSGMKLCNEEMLSSFYNTINRVGGYKRLIFRRGIQRP
ncbi:hypothetical protein PUR21_31050 [Methylorubrum rhodesianum]|uniref:Uncharacterized protein n=1 Tax=Methylorubrum rhodesianum TaxID=29427 RepID=A0ABU9ZKL0_9HYPH